MGTRKAKTWVSSVASPCVHCQKAVSGAEQALEVGPREMRCVHAERFVTTAPNAQMFYFKNALQMKTTKLREVNNYATM